MKEQEAKEEDLSEKKRPVSEMSSDDDKEKSNKRSKLEACLTELSDMMTQIRNDAKLVASSTQMSLKNCKETSEAVSEFARHGLKALPKKKPSAGILKDKENV